MRMQPQATTGVVMPNGTVDGIVPANDTVQSYPSPITAWYCVLVIALTLMINFLDRSILPLLIPAIKADLHISDSAMGVIMGLAFTIFYALFGLPVARLVDRGTRKLIYSAGLGIFAVVMLTTGFARNFWQLFATRIAMGVGETTSGPSAYSLLSDYFPPKQLPRAFSAMQIGFVVGVSAAPALGAAAIAYATAHPGLGFAALEAFKPWQLTLMLVSIPGFFVALLMLTVPEPKRRGAIQPTQFTDVFGLVGRHGGVYWPLFIGMGLRSAQMFATQTWTFTYFQRHFAWTSVQYGFIWAPLSLGAMVLGLAAGWLLSEYFQRRGRADGNVRVVLISTMVSVPFGILAPLMPTPQIALVMFAVANMTSIMAAAPENAAIQSVTPNRMRGQMTFLFLFIMNVVGNGLGPQIVPTLNDLVFGEQGIGTSMVVMGLVCGIPAIIAFALGRKHYGAAYAAGGVENLM